MVIIELSGRKAGGRFAIVDEIDAGFLRQWSWNFVPKGYAIRTDRTGGKKRTIYMHKEIGVRMGIMYLGQVDHRDGVKLNNTRSNLRAATNQLNQANVGLQKNNQSGFKGVSKRRGRFMARIGVSRKRLHLGYFDTPEQASQAYREAAEKHFGEFARS